MNNVFVVSFVDEDSTSVSVKSLGHCDSTGDRSAVVDLSHHMFFAVDMSVFLNIVNWILIRYKAILMRCAVLAVHNRRAFDSVIVAFTLVGGAGLVSDPVVVNPLESIEGVASMAPVVVHITRKQNLRSDVDFRPCSFPGYLNSVGEGGGSSLGPAGSAVLGHVLLSDGRQIVNSFYVVPSVLLRNWGIREI